MKVMSTESFMFSLDYTNYFVVYLSSFYRAGIFFNNQILGSSFIARNVRSKVKKKINPTSACNRHWKMFILYCLVFILCRLLCVSMAGKKKLFILQILNKLAFRNEVFDMHSIYVFVSIHFLDCGRNSENTDKFSGNTDKNSVR